LGKQQRQELNLPVVVSFMLPVPCFYLLVFLRSKKAPMGGGADLGTM